ncbi:hypothetical protein [Rhizobium sp. Root482]|uniref:hypothetical protein n=1 Tax=Rhizobium sp. Root482 TaxID=1736543 RepID=UPI0006F8AD8C|nr:hypothetical protein [Rhizobium sp. Root482]KQY26214.1 hypothetical protein ASD31_19615 [Rhizobium sp. Root482]
MARLRKSDFHRVTILDPETISDIPETERPYHWSLGYSRKVEGTLVGYSAAKGYLGKAPSQYEVIRELMETRGYRTEPESGIGATYETTRWPHIIDIAFFRIPDEIAALDAGKIERWLDKDPLDYLIDVVRMYQNC